MDFRILLAGALGIVLLEACSPSAKAPPSAAEKPVTFVAPAGTYRLDPLHSALTWTITHNGLSHYVARFRTVDARIEYNPQDLSASRIEVTVDPMSVQTNYPLDYKALHPQTGFPSWDAEIGHSQRFLNGDKFPKITFRSTKVERTGPRTGRVTGDLSFIGITRPVTMDVTFNGDLSSHPFLHVPDISFAARGEISRSAFGMPSLGPTVGDVATIAFDGEFTRIDPNKAAAEIPRTKAGL